MLIRRLLPCVIAVCSLVVLSTTVRSAETGRTLHIRVPDGFDAKKLLVDVGEYGNGVAISQPRPSQDGREVIQNINAATKSVKVLMYYPGYRIVTAELKTQDISAAKPFAPAFVKLPVVTTKLRLIHSDGKPIVSQKVELREQLMEASYFGYSDGFIMDFAAAPVASATTDNSGIVSMQVPVLSADTTYAKYWRGKPSFWVAVPMDGQIGYDIIPPQIPAQKAYAKTIDVKIVCRAKLTGILRQSFLTKHGVDIQLDKLLAEDVFSINISAQSLESNSGMGTSPNPDGTFSLTLPAGKYDLSINLFLKDLDFKSIPIEKGVVLGEGQTKELVLE